MRVADKRAPLRYRLPVEARSEADDRRLDHLDIADMSDAERWAESFRVNAYLASLAPWYDPIMMRYGEACSGRLWLMTRLRLLGIGMPAARVGQRG
jgi:hypothetical protein